MPNFVTPEEVAAQLRLDDLDAETPWLNIWIPGISQAIQTWLKDDWRAYVPLEDSNGDIIDSNGDPIPSDVVQPVVKAACLVELAQQYRYRDGTNATPVPSHWGHGYILGAGATSLLVGLRKSTVR